MSASHSRSQVFACAKNNRRLALRNSWVEFLGHYDWSMVITLTFDRKKFRPSFDPDSERAETAFRQLIRYLNEQLYGRRWMSKPPRGGAVWARVHEPQKDGTLHYHAVLYCHSSSITAELLVNLREWWRARYGLAVVEVPRSKSATLRYLVKHVGSFENAEVEFSYNFKKA
jgi:hypothetical protein